MQVNKNFIDNSMNKTNEDYLKNLSNLNTNFKDTFLQRKRRGSDSITNSNKKNKKFDKNYSDEKITKFFKVKKYGNKQFYSLPTSKLENEESNEKMNSQNEISNLDLINNFETPTNLNGKNIIFEQEEEIINNDIFVISKKTLDVISSYGKLPEKACTIDTTKLPLSNVSSKNSFIAESEKILKSLSMKEKYEELLNRELILPPPYKMLFLMFNFLEKQIKSLKLEKAKKINFFERINGMNIEDFQQILFVHPIGFLYKYEIFPSSKSELLIDIPKDYLLRVEKKINETDLSKLQSLELQVGIDSNYCNDEFLALRSKKFKEALINLTKIQHDTFLKRKNIKFDALKQSTWHSEFNLNNVQKIKLFKLAEKLKKKTNRI